MIRRSIAGLILGVALIFASLAWSGFVALQTVFDPDRSSEVADDLLDDADVRKQLAENIASAVGAGLPEEAGVTDAQVQTAAEVVLDDPAVRALVFDSFAQTHAAFLGEGDAPETLDAGAFGTASRGALVSAAPALDAVLPQAPQLEVDLPTEHIPNAGPIRDAVQVAVPVLGLAALGGVALALLATNDRPYVLRRAGFWALSATAVVLIIGLGLPWLIRQVAPDQAIVLAALISSLLKATLTPAIGLALGGVSAIGVATFWPKS